MNMIYVLLPVLGMFLQHGDGFKKGAGDTACVNMEPGHYGTNPSTDPAPFYLQVSKNLYSPGDILTGIHRSFRGRLLPLMVD